jgi:xylan 1,4-beta-xylosidase
MYASYTAASYARIWEMARQQHVQLDGALTWAFTFVGQPWFAGYRQLATNGVDLPVLNVFRLFARLGAEQVNATSSNEIPLARIVSDGVRDRPDVGVLATRGQQGRVDVLLWHYQDDDVPGPSADVHVVLTGLAPGLEREAHVWRVDRDSGNAFAEWLRMGSPASPSKQQIDQLISASHVTKRALQLAPRAHDGSVSLDRQLPLHSVELIELGS